MPQLQGSRRTNPNEPHPSIMDTDDAHVPDCLVWRDRYRGDEGRPVPPGRVRRWYCQNYNRCDENYFRQAFCRQYHAKSGPDASTTKPCQRWHCPGESCQNNKCSYNHCHDPDCRRAYYESAGGCREPNCRRCRGLDPKINRDIGYTRRPELGRPKDRGIRSEPPTYRARPLDGSAAEAVAGWPERKSAMKRNGLLEPLATGRLDPVNGGGVNDVARERKIKDDEHIRRHVALAGHREDPRELWKMPRFTNGAKPRISTFRNPDDPAFPTNGRAAADDEGSRARWPQQTAAPNMTTGSNYDGNQQEQYQVPPAMGHLDNGFDHHHPQQQQPYGNVESYGDIDRLQSYRTAQAAGDNARSQQYLNDNSNPYVGATY